LSISLRQRADTSDVAAVAGDLKDMFRGGTGVQSTPDTDDTGAGIHSEVARLVNGVVDLTVHRVIAVVGV